MTKKDSFYTLYKEYHRIGERREISLVDLTRQLKDLFKVWSGMRTNARVVTQPTMNSAISIFFRLLFDLSKSERKENFEMLKEEMPDVDDFFVCIDRRFPWWEILSKLSVYGYTKPQN